MYRAYWYIRGTEFAGHRVTSAPVATVEQADRLMWAVLDLGGYSGGGLEMHVAGFGWCVADAPEPAPAPHGKLRAAMANAIEQAVDEVMA